MYGKNFIPFFFVPPKSTKPLFDFFFTSRLDPSIDVTGHGGGGADRGDKRNGRRSESGDCRGGRRPVRWRRDVGEAETLDRMLERRR
ncbi:hypothetical protein E3N88_33550 [Mikania micrantha]|uniref:Uncharacterized protein n=1 Tax=Mikania micrantha TaxID=192012 RepID=A0A5N6MBJ9_9ASTR|nr:hypothetical protein E3N88_33550 [Mikania micrantha]